MDTITIVITLTTMIVHDGQVKGSRLKYQAPGLDIYIKGACPAKELHRVHYIAMSEALARHIPLVSLKAYGKV